MPGVPTMVEALQRRADTEQVTFTTTQLSGGQTHDIELTEDDDNIDSITFKPTDAELPSEALLFVARPIVDSGSTDTDFSIFEDGARNDVDEVLRIEALSVNDAVQTFQPGSGTGVPFDNQDDENRWFVRFNEQSATDSVYTVRLRWFDVAD